MKATFVCFTLTVVPSLINKLNQLFDVNIYRFPLPPAYLAVQRPSDLLILYAPNNAPLDEIYDWILKKNHYRPNLTTVLIHNCLDHHNLLTMLELGVSICLDTKIPDSELVTHIKAQIRYLNNQAQTYLYYDKLRVNPAAQQVEVDRQNVYLRKKEYLILLELLRNQDRIISKDKLYTALWPDLDDPLSNSLEVHVHSLRHKLSVAGMSNIIETLVGRGYIIRTKHEPAKVTPKNQLTSRQYRSKTLIPN